MKISKQTLALKVPGLVIRLKITKIGSSVIRPFSWFYLLFNLIN